MKNEQINTKTIVNGFTLQLQAQLIKINEIINHLILLVIEHI